MTVIRRTPQAPGLGRHVRHDPRSAAYALPVLPKAALRTMSWARRVPVFDQGDLGSCFPPGTRVRMADGSERPIEDVRLGERVVTAEGNTGRVVRTLLRDEDGGLLRLHVWGHAHLRMTREHPVLTARGYISAAELRVGDEVAFPRYFAEPGSVVGAINPQELVRQYRADSNPLPDKIKLDAAAGRLFGLWLAEGSADGTKVRWHYGGHEEHTLVRDTVELCRLVLGEEVHAVQRPNGAWWVTLYGSRWNELFKVLGGTRVDTKKPHGLLCSGPAAFLEAMLNGWLDGDGHRRKDGSREGVSVSHDLALAMYDIGQALGAHPVIDHRESPQNSAARVRLPRWTVTFAPGQGRARTEDSHVWRKLRAIHLEDYVGPVYDLTVEGDHSYVAEGMGVHNCTGNAAAGWLVTDNAARAGLTMVGSTAIDERMAVDIYSAATKLDSDPDWFNPTTGKVDTGSDGLSVAKVLQGRGLAVSYQHAFAFAAVVSALQSGSGMAGTTWHRSMFDTEVDGHIKVDLRSPVDGGHEYIVDALEVDAAGNPTRVWMTNSWGSSWGVNGAGYFTPAEFTALLADQGDFTVPSPVTASPAPSPGDSDATLWSATKAWATARHSGDNRRAAVAVAAWAKAKRLS